MQKIIASLLMVMLTACGGGAAQAGISGAPYNPQNVKITGGTVAGNVSGAVGVGQTWQTFPSGRVFGAKYTNSTGRAIAISISSQNAIAAYNSGLVIDGVGVATFVCNINARCNLFGIIPAGAIYAISSSDINTSLVVWAELR